MHQHTTCDLQKWVAAHAMSHMQCSRHTFMWTIWDLPQWDAAHAMFACNAATIHIYMCHHTAQKECTLKGAVRTRLVGT